MSISSASIFSGKIRSNTVQNNLLNIPVDVSEDEEQTAKLTEIIELLLAAGYFRARIKGLSSFDKVVGGMTWCITTCSYDIDVDLLFQENSTIGQKISLTEKIVAVLPKMNCPHSIEPHQIQGLDFIHIFPVVQWLVKKAIETREEMGDYVRHYSIFQFDKYFDVPTISTTKGIKEMKVKTIGLIKQTSQNQLDAKKDASEEEVNQQKIELYQKQIEHSSDAVEQLQKQKTDLEQESKNLKEKVDELLAFSKTVEEQLSKFIEAESGLNEDVIQNLRDLIAQNEKLKRQEQDFRQSCKNEKSRLETEIEKLKTEETDMGGEDPEQIENLTSQLNKDKEKLQKTRLNLARKNREIVSLERKIDEVPSRAELSQYQRRFLELYDQVAAKHKETKQFYTLYNTLDDTKLYLNKEVNLLNSIYDTFEQAMSSTSGKDQFLKQMEDIVEGVKQNRLKLEKKAQEEKSRKDLLNDDYLDLLEKQRLYYKTVKDFKEECRKNEIIMSKIKE